MLEIFLSSAMLNGWSWFIELLFFSKKKQMWKLYRMILSKLNKTDDYLQVEAMS